MVDWLAFSYDPESYTDRSLSPDRPKLASQTNELGIFVLVAGMSKYKLDPSVVVPERFLIRNLGWGENEDLNKG